MCGISGIFFFKGNNKVEKKNLVKMNKLLDHRGPDGNGSWISPNKKVGFGHTRLAIQDISINAHQPMISYDGYFAIIFDGEIYNFKEIRRRLEIDKKLNFKIKSNT